jgi:hypothetical protein
MNIDKAVPYLRLPTTVARVRPQVMSNGIRGRKSRTGAGLLLVLQFFLPIIIPLTAPHSLSPYHHGYIISIQTASLNNQLKEENMDTILNGYKICVEKIKTI